MMLADMSQGNEYYDWVVWSFDKAGIPLNYVVTPNGPTIELPTIVTQGIVYQALNQAAVVQ